MSGSFKAYVEARRAGNHQTSPEASPRGQGPSAEGQGQTNEPTNYESARDMSPLVPEAVRRTWQQADREEHLLRQQMERILDDETLVHEAKSKGVGELFDSKSSAIADKRRETREALLKAADAAYRASIPVFLGETITASDSTALLATQNEAARIVRTIEAKQKKSGPFPFRTTDYLQSEYRRGLQIQGVEGGAILRGVLRAAVELGVSTEEVLSGEGIRKERHIESVDKARRLEFFSEMISTQPISMPRRTRDRLRRGSGGASTIGAQRSSAALVGGEHQPIAKAQESHSQGSASEASKAKRKRSFK